MLVNAVPVSLDHEAEARLSDLAGRVVEKVAGVAGDAVACHGHLVNRLHGQHRAVSRLHQSVIFSVPVVAM